MPYAEVINNQHYPTGSALASVLSSEAVKKEGSIWPILNKTYVSYVTHSDRWSRTSQNAFHIIVEFAASVDDTVGGKNISALVPTDQCAFNNKKGEQGNEDVVGKIRIMGSSEWWSGSEATIRANKLRFLRNEGG
jgi:hypothetical protein